MGATDHHHLSTSNINTTTTNRVNDNCSALRVRILSGSAGSILTSLIVTPLEVVKVRMQVAATETITQHPNVQACPRGCGTFVLYNGQLETVLPRNAASFFDCHTGTLTQHAQQQQATKQGTLRALHGIFRAEGFAGLYAGLRPTLVMAVPNTVLYFSAYEELAHRLRSNSSDHSAMLVDKKLVPLVAGGAARLCASTVTAPFELIRTRQALAVGSGTVARLGIWKELSGVIQHEGFLSLYQGLRPTLWRDVPFSAIYWTVLEAMRDAWRQRAAYAPSPVEQAMQAFGNGAVAGTMAAAATTPFDVVKTRQQQFVHIPDSAVSASVQNNAHLLCKHDGAVIYDAAAVSQSSSSGTFASLKRIAETEGIRGLWRGNVARMMKVAPSCAIMISSYEFGKRILE
jgi:solute carrier family 25 protein 39/40